MLVEPFNLPCQPVRRIQIVRIAARQNLAARSRKPGVERRGNPLAWPADDPHPRIVDLLDDLHRSIRRAVIDDDHFQLHVALRKHRIQCRRHIRLGVAHRDEYAQ